MSARNPVTRYRSHATCRAFTMIEVAISLAIIGIALVGIIGVLPIGMRTQQDVREETIVNQDATVLMEAIRNGSKGADDLTNYVYEITNTWTEYNLNNNDPIVAVGSVGYTYLTYSPNPAVLPSIYSTHPINSGTNIIGLLTTPEFQDANTGLPIPAPQPLALPAGNFYSNHIVAYVYSMSGPAVEKPPQDSGGIVQQSSFAYRMIVQNVPVPVPTAANTAGRDYNFNEEANLYELRLFFRWPQQPSGSLGQGAQSFRTMIAGTLVTDTNQPTLCFFQPQSFTTNTDIKAEGGP